MNLLADSGAGVLAAVLVASAAFKVADVRGTVRQLRAYELLPARALGAPAVLLLVAAEAGLAAGLVLGGPRHRPTAAGLALLLLLFAGAMAVNLLRGRRDISCGCWGARSSRISWGKVAANLAVAVTALLLAYTAPALAGPSAPTAGTAGRLALAGGAAVLFLVAGATRQALRQLRAELADGVQVRAGEGS